jgi:hypothetical protein
MGRFVRHSKNRPHTTAAGQNENAPFSGLCQLPPAADMPPLRLHSAMCQQPTYAVQQKPLFDDLVGDREQRRGDCDAKCLGGLDVNHEVKLGWQLYGQIGRLFAPQNAVHIEGG